MGQLVQPKTYIVGYTMADFPGIRKYLEDTDQTQFMSDIDRAIEDDHLSAGEILCSMFAKLCYKSLVVGKNENISKTRKIKDNIRATFDSGHGSVFEHATVNFITTDCSRIFTHELVRQRAGWAYSQTSGRYCRLDKIDFVFDPILEGCQSIIDNLLFDTEKSVYLMECIKGLRRPPDKYPNIPCEACYWTTSNWIDITQSKTYQDTLGIKRETTREEVKWVPNEKLDFNIKKKITSAIRRVAPNGQNNEIAYSVNFRALRHFIMLRSGRHAEWEIRVVANQIFDLLHEKFPMLFYGCKSKMFDGLNEYYGMKMQPYEMDSTNPEAIQMFSNQQLEHEMVDRGLLSKPVGDR